MLYGRWDEHVLAPYQAFREALTDYARACPEALLRHDLGDLAGEIARLCPEPAQRVGASAAEPLGGGRRPSASGCSSRSTRGSRRMGARHPVLLVLDDLQWADLPSVLLLSHLHAGQALYAAAHGGDVPRPRAGAGRPVGRAALPGPRRRLPPADAARARADAVTSLLQGAVGREFGERESGMVAELERDTAGNPFFLLEMARHLSELGAFDREGPGWARPGRDPGVDAGHGPVAVAPAVGPAAPRCWRSLG